MKLERLIFKNDKGEFVDIPASEIESLYSELGKLLDGLAVKKAKPESKETDGMKPLRECWEKIEAERAKEKQRNIPMPPNWPEFPSPSWPYPLHITCEEQPLRFEWGGIEGDKVRLRATQQYRFTTNAPA